MFASIESLLLKNSGEPIQKTIGQRLAFLLYPDAKRRASTIAMVNEAYGLRSNYIHHGGRMQNLQLTTDVSITVAGALRASLRKRDKFTTYIQFIDAIESVLLS